MLYRLYVSIVEAVLFDIVKIGNKKSGASPVTQNARRGDILGISMG
jgi:hypothetical protein